MATFAINETARREQYVSTGQATYNFNFQVNVTDELLVYVNDTAQTLSVQYNATLNAGGTGSITFIDNSGSGGTNYTPANGDRITIIGDLALSRTTTLNTAGDITTTNLDTEFDNTVIRQQQIKEITDRALQLKPSTPRTVTGSGTSGPIYFPYDATVANNADRIIKYNAAGTGLEIGSTTTNIDSLAAIASDISSVSSISANVTAVAADEADIGIVSSNISSVQTVATNINDVITVANDLNEAISEVETVANDLNEAVSEIDTVGNNITYVQTVGDSTNIANITTVAGQITPTNNISTVASANANISTVATDLSGSNTIGTVATDLSGVNNIGTVVTNISNVNTVGTNLSGSNTIGTVATNINDVNTVAADTADIQTLADIEDGTVATNAVSNAGNNSTNITTVAGQITPTNNILTVANANSNITTVAGQISPTNNIATVAGANASITTVATNLTGTNTIGTVAGSIANVNLVGGSIANVNEVANNIGTVNNFGDRYRVQAGEPSVNNDEGDLVYDTTANAVKVYNGTSFDTIQQGITDTAPTRHSIRPSLNLDFANSKELDPRITFTRASNATYYDGYTSVKAEENLVTYSQEFNNAVWIKAQSAITANNIDAPDGTQTADKLRGTVTGTSTPYVMIQSSEVINISNGTTLFLSIHAKAGEFDFLFIQHNHEGGGYPKTYFNLSTGTIGTVGSGHTASIISVGNGWYRCSITFSRNVGFPLIGTSSTDGVESSTTNGTDGIYIWGAQLEKRASLTAYTPTTTQPITNYVPAIQTAGNNVARFDHNPTTGESLGLLIEESRTNVATYSEDYTQSVWTKSETTVTSNTIIAPDGFLTGSKLIENTLTTSHSLWIRPSFTLGNYYSFSFYVKSAEKSIIVITLYNSSYSYARANFNLSSGTTTASTQAGCSSSIVDVGNGWYRCTLIGLADATATGYAGLTLAPDGYTDTIQPGYTGDGYSGVYVWGAQVEQASFPTSYIKTTGSQVTRSADDAEMTGTNFTSWYNYNGGTLYGECIQPAPNTYATLAYMTESDSQSNRIELRARNAGTASRAYTLTPNGLQCDFNLSSVAEDNLNKMIIAFTFNDFAATNNGGTIQTDNSGTISDLFVRLNIGSTGVGNFLNSTIKKVVYYPTRLTNNELVDLTEE